MQPCFPAPGRGGVASSRTFSPCGAVCHEPCGLTEPLWEADGALPVLMWFFWGVGGLAWGRQSERGRSSPVSGSRAPDALPGHSAWILRLSGHCWLPEPLQIPGLSLSIPPRHVPREPPGLGEEGASLSGSLRTLSLPMGSPRLLQSYGLFSSPGPPASLAARSRSGQHVGSTTGGVSLTFPSCSSHSPLSSFVSCLRRAWQGARGPQWSGLNKAVIPCRPGAAPQCLRENGLW